MPNKMLTKNGCVIRKHIATRPVIFD